METEQDNVSVAASTRPKAAQGTATPGPANVSKPKSIFEVPIYREKMPPSFEKCKQWFDVVVFFFYKKLASVTFVVDRQEELLRFSSSEYYQIQRAWLLIAISDYQTEFLRIYDFFNYFDHADQRVRELYNKHSYFFVSPEQKTDTMRNIRDNYLNKFDLLQPRHPLITRYAHYLF